MGVTANFQMNSKFQDTNPLAEDGRRCVPCDHRASPTSSLACREQGVKRAAGAAVCRGTHCTAAEGFSSPQTLLNSRYFIHTHIILSYCLKGKN